MLALERQGTGDVPATQTTPQAVFDYFAAEVFDDFDEQSQQFLLNTAWLSKFTAAMARQLTDHSGPDKVLKHLARRNYFIAVHQGVPPVYEYHHLFSAFLQHRTNDTYLLDELHELKYLSARVLAEADDIEAAVVLFQDIEAWEELLALALRVAPDLIEQGRHQSLATWLAAIPEAWCRQAPWVEYWRGVCVLPFDPAQARVHLETAYERFKNAKNDRLGLLSAWCRIIDSFVYEWGDFHPVDRWIEEIEPLLAEPSAFPSPTISAQVACGMFMALMYRQPQNPQLLVWAERVQAIVLHHPEARARMVLGNQLLLYYTTWIGDLSSARLILDAVRPPEDMAVAAPLAFIAWCTMEAGYFWFMAAHDDCLRAVNKGLEVADQSGVQILNAFLSSQGVIGSLTSGDSATAERLLKNTATATQGARQLDRAHYYYLKFLDAFFRKDTLHTVTNARQAVALGDAAGVPFGQALYRLGLAQALFDQGERREALACLAQARRIGRRMRSANIEFGCLFSLALFALDRGRDRLAINLLRKTLHMAKQHGYVNRPLWTPEIMRRLFSVALENDIEVEYVQHLIRIRRLEASESVRHLENWPWQVRIHALDRFTVSVHDKPLPSSGKAQRRPLDLLKCLIACGEGGLPIEQVVEALWPNMDGAKAYHAYTSAVYRLRKLLHCEEAVLTEDGRVGLNTRRCWIDAWTFENLLEQAALQNASEAEQAAYILTRAINLYRGSFLNDEQQDIWAITYHERLHGKYMQTALDLGRLLERRREFVQALEHYQRSLEHDDLREALYQRILACCCELGWRAEGLAAFERCQGRLQETLGVPPSGQTLALRDRLVAEH